jgi:tetratricopeptide (TPR) repeat protein
MNEPRAEGSRTDWTSATTPTAAELCETGLRHLRAGRTLGAHICCRRALEIDAEYADALHLLGLIALQGQQYEHAVDWLARAIRQDPKPEYLLALGKGLRLSGRLNDAVRVFEKAVRLRPSDADSWKQLGGALVACDRHADALLAYRQVLKLKPRQWEAAVQSAVLLYRLERFEEALAYFNLCDRLKPDHPATLRARSRTLRALKRREERLADVMRANAL